MAETIVKKRPIDAFIEYFNDVKPYHAKILEVVEKYNFYDDVNVSIDESISNSISIANKPLCKGVGFGLEWDDPECGFDAVECCTLGTCATDSTIFDNLTDAVQTPIVSVSDAEGKVTVQGNYSYDSTYQIKRILTKDSFTISGDITGLLAIQPLFFLVSYNTLDYVYNSVNSIKLSGNYAQQFIDRRTFTIYGSNRNDGTYHVVSANYAPATNITTIIVSETMFINDFGKILVPTKTVNSGLYNVVSSNFNGADTTVVIDNTNRDLVIEDVPASIILKTGFLQGRVIELKNDQTNVDYVIVDSKYNYINDTTDVYVINQLQPSDPTNTAVLKIKVDATSYLADTNCKPPKENNLSVNFAEQLVITVTNVVPPPSTLVATTELQGDNSGYWQIVSSLYDDYCNHTYSSDSVVSADVQWYVYSNSTPSEASPTTDPDTCIDTVTIDPAKLTNSGSFTIGGFSKNINQYSVQIFNETLVSALNGIECMQVIILSLNITTGSGKTVPSEAVMTQWCV